MGSVYFKIKSIVLFYNVLIKSLRSQDFHIHSEGSSIERLLIVISLCAQTIKIVYHFILQLSESKIRVVQ